MLVDPEELDAMGVRARERLPAELREAPLLERMDEKGHLAAISLTDNPERIRHLRTVLWHAWNCTFRQSLTKYDFEVFAYVSARIEI